MEYADVSMHFFGRICTPCHSTLHISSVQVFLHAGHRFVGQILLRSQVVQRMKPVDAWYHRVKVWFFATAAAVLITSHYQLVWPCDMHSTPTVSLPWGLSWGWRPMSCDRRLTLLWNRSGCHWRLQEFLICLCKQLVLPTLQSFFWPRTYIQHILLIIIIVIIIIVIIIIRTTTIIIMNNDNNDNNDNK